MAGELQAWDIQPGETVKAYRAFALYRDLGPDRSLAKLGGILGKTRQNFDPWARDHRWSDRAHAFDVHIAIATAARSVDDHVAVKLRHAALAVELQDWGMEVVRDATEVKATDGIAAIRNGVAIERKARDIPDRAPVDEDGKAVPAVAIVRFDPDAV